MHHSFDKIAPGIPNKSQLGVDILCGVCCIFAAVGAKRWSESALEILVFSFLLSWVTLAAVMRLYSPATPRRLWDFFTLRLIGVLGIAVELVLLDELMHRDVRLDPVLFVVTFFAAMAATRLVVYRPLARIATAHEEILIVGTGALGVATYKQLVEAIPEERRRVVGFLHFEGEPEQLTGVAQPVLGGADQLLTVLSQRPVSEIYLAGAVLEHGDEMQRLVEICERVGMPFAVPLHCFRLERARLIAAAQLRDGFLHYMSTAQKPVQYALKRLIDITASAFALLVLSPLLIGVAIAIKLSSPGPILFRQERVGLLGSRFGLLKFRSMVHNAEELKEKLLALNEQTGPVFKMKNDPRVTLVGRFIRKYSIDELPQLVNILRGDMTIVGPRPALPSEVSQYMPWQRRRLSVRPGLTCYWQVGGRNAIGFDDWMRLDLRYVDHWNLAVDLQLILQTFAVVLAGKGAS